MKLINWLVNTSKSHDITDNPIMRNDNVNVSKLSLFYKVICSYAKNNYVMPSKDGNITSFVIAYNNELLLLRRYKIESLSIYVCSNVTEYKNDFLNNIIDYNDIRDNKKRDNKEEIDHAISSLKNNIMFLMQEGVPTEYLEGVIKHTIKNNDNNKKLSKTIRYE